MRPIDADALRELIDGGYDVDFDELPETKQALLEMIDYQDTVDAVEVIRCRDCKWWKLSEYNTFGIHCCKKFSGVRGEHDFCSRAERRE